MLAVTNFLLKLQPYVTSALHNKNKILPFLSCLPFLFFKQNFYMWHSIANLTLQGRKNLCPSIMTTSSYSTEHKQNENQYGQYHYSFLQLLCNKTFPCQKNSANCNHYPYAPNVSHNS